MLSIIIPTYKRQASLFKLLDILLRQTLVDREIIVVDQNKPGFFNDQEEIVFKNVNRVLLDKPNASVARNIGFRAAKGKYILFIDDDLIPEENFCEIGMRIFHQRPEIKCFTPIVYNIDGAAVAVSQAERKILSGDVKSSTFVISDTMSAVVFFERDYFESTGGFHEDLFEFAKTAEDQEFFLRMRKLGMQLWFVKEVSIFHDESNPGGCDLRTADYWATREKCVRAWAYRCRIHNEDHPGSIFLTDFIKLSRSAFLNKEVLSSGIFNIKRQIDILFRAIKESREFYINKTNNRQDKVIISNNV